MNVRAIRPRIALLLAGIVATAMPVLALADPPGRVARVSYLAGEVSFAPAGEDTWHAATLNRPMVVGDRLWTDRGARTELELGTAVLRMDQGSSVDFLNLDDMLAQIQLTEGTINLRVDYVHEGQAFEVNTPTLAMVVTTPGQYRVDVAPNADSTQVTVFDGRAEIYGETSRTVIVQGGNSFRFHDSALANVQRMSIPAADDFDRWASARNDRQLNSPTRQYVSTEMIGYADLDGHGSWRHVRDYGNVWFPTRVAPGWAPYRYGHWSWIDPWGWTWIDDASWGFAPSHYGRWVYVSSGWGWVPGPRHLRPMYAPALVAFVGGSGWSLTVRSGGPPIGWFPLGPRDVYMPWYRVSRGYFGRVNVHNTVVVNNIYVTNVYNDYYVQGRAPNRDYTFRGAANAVTVVPQDSFVSARRAADSMARLRPGTLQQGELLTRAPATPTRASLTGGGTGRAAPALSDRQVVARTEPAPRMASFDRRQPAIARNGGEPLASDQLRRISSAADGRTATPQVRMTGRDGAIATAAAQRPTDSRSGTGRGELGSVARQPAPVAGGVDRTSATRQSVQRPRGDTATAGQRATAPAAASAPGRTTGTTTAPAAREQSRALPSANYSRTQRGNTGAAAPGNRVGERATAPATRTTAPARGTQPPAAGISLPATRQQAPARSQAPARTSQPPVSRTTTTRPQQSTAPARQTAPAAAPSRQTPSTTTRQSVPQTQTPARSSNTPARATPQPRTQAPASTPQPRTQAPARNQTPARSSTPPRAATQQPRPAQQPRAAAQPPASREQATQRSNSNNSAERNRGSRGN